MLRLTRRRGESRTIDVHLHWHLLADVVSELAARIEAAPLDNEVDREPLAASAERLLAALRETP
jgi:hypothetical protein